MSIFNGFYGEAKDTKSLMRRKNKGEKEASAKAKRLESVSSESSPSTQSMACPNNKCKRVFTKPLELIDLAKPSAKSSYVCPFCLSILEPTQPEQETVTETSPSEKFEDVTKQKEEKCPQFLGYLHKRPKDAPIPEFCLTCPQMMKCLLG